jgi:hypothetical protein
MMGQNLQANPEDLLMPPDTVNLWDRYISGRDDPSSEQVQQRRVVLQHLALFKRFGYGRAVITEAQAIASVIQRVNPQITWARFQEIITAFRRRRILQGEATLYITPKLLHIKLWCDWWELYGHSFQLDEFSTDLPISLVEWFYEMFKYARESEIASRIVKELLGAGGPFHDSNYLQTELGARFFQALAEADPRAGLRYLQQTVGRWNKEKLLRFTTGRREVVWALEKIAMWRSLFMDAARLLLVLGEAENERWSNNASGVFIDLFSPGHGPVAPTEASPEERFPILKEALESDSQDRRILALRACEAALNTRNFTRIGGSERQGLRSEPQLWVPKTWEELFDAYRRVWYLLRDKVDELPGREQEQAVHILLSYARGLGGIQNLADMVVDTIEELIDKPYIDKRKILEAILRILRYEQNSLPEETLKRWSSLKNRLIGDDYSSLMQRYVGMDLLEDKFDDQRRHVDQIPPWIEKLVVRTLQDRELLYPELTWLVTDEAKNGFRFGYELGKHDQNFSFLPLLVDAQRNAGDNASAFFLGGYFRALFQRDPRSWETQLDRLMKDKKLVQWIPELTWRSGMSSRAARRLLKLARAGLIEARHFRMMAFGSVIQELSQGIFKQWIEFLLDTSTPEAISIALDLFHFYYAFQKPPSSLPEALTLRLLTHDVVFQKREDSNQAQIDDNDWSEIAKALVEAYPKKGLVLAEKVLEHLGASGTIFDGFHSSSLEVLNAIARRYPQKIWSLAARYLGPPIDSRAFHINNWLRGDDLFEEGAEGMLAIIPLESIWEWVNDDTETRAWYLASFVPKTLHREQGKVCLAREVLIRYGDRDDVRRNLMANFSTEGWSGPESLHHQNKKQKLLEFQKGEENANVKRWLDEYIEALEHSIERAKMREERDDF